jgi:hypothetical protein
VEAGAGELCPEGISSVCSREAGVHNLNVLGEGLWSCYWVNSSTRLPIRSNRERWDSYHAVNGILHRDLTS